jgi:hypothetical protein
MINNPGYLNCPKCGTIMHLRNDNNSILPSGGTATNSTGTFNTGSIWYEYYCPKCEETHNSFIRYQQSE